MEALTWAFQLFPVSLPLGLAAAVLATSALGAWSQARGRGSAPAALAIALLAGGFWCWTWWPPGWEPGAWVYLVALSASPCAGAWAGLRALRRRSPWVQVIGGVGGGAVAALVAPGVAMFLSCLVSRGSCT